MLTASVTRYSVIILVMLAGGRGTSAFSDKSTSPVVGSSRTADFRFNPNDSTEGILTAVALAVVLLAAAVPDSVVAGVFTASANTGITGEANIFKSRPTVAVLITNCLPLNLCLYFND
ncbi:hypothetical protein D3C81_1963410 [compost metagenome]